MRGFLLITFRRGCAGGRGRIGRNTVPGCGGFVGHGSSQGAGWRAGQNGSEGLEIVRVGRRGGDWSFEAVFLFDDRGDARGQRRLDYFGGERPTLRSLEGRKDGLGDGRRHLVDNERVTCPEGPRVRRSGDGARGGTRSSGEEEKRASRGRGKEPQAMMQGERSISGKPMHNRHSLFQDETSSAGGGRDESECCGMPLNGRVGA